MKKLQQLIATLEKRIPDHNLLNPAISKGSVGWHIEHSLLTLNVIMAALKQSHPHDYKPTFDLRREVVMLLGIIPRGKVKAPTVVRPAETFNEQTLAGHLLVIRNDLENIMQLSPGHFFTHPFLGDFRLKQAVTFMKIHTHHHVKIINDIVANSKAIKN